ncbi:hypothetical protein C0995_012000 [Termitomyces sp. Mi166|nr:hypothetical protein C0995_012000 [Termitomyces sp. Mi166\
MGHNGYLVAKGLLTAFYQLEGGKKANQWAAGHRKREDSGKKGDTVGKKQTATRPPVPQPIVGPFKAKLTAPTSLGKSSVMIKKLSSMIAKPKEKASATKETTAKELVESRNEEEDSEEEWEEELQESELRRSTVAGEDAGMWKEMEPTRPPHQTITPLLSTNLVLEDAFFLPVVLEVLMRFQQSCAELTRSQNCAQTMLTMQAKTFEQMQQCFEVLENMKLAVLGLFLGK